MADKPMSEEEKAKALFKLLSMSAKRVKQGKEMKHHEIALLRRMFPDTYRLCRNLSFDEMIALDSKYINHETYGENIRTMLSPEGKAWLKDSLAKIKTYDEEH